MSAHNKKKRKLNHYFLKIIQNKKHSNIGDHELSSDTITISKVKNGVKPCPFNILNLKKSKYQILKKMEKNSVQFNIMKKINIKNQLFEFRNKNPEKTVYKKQRNNLKTYGQSQGSNTIKERQIQTLSFLGLNKEMVETLKKNKSLSWMQLTQIVKRKINAKYSKENMFFVKKLIEDKNSFLNKFQKKFIKEIEGSFSKENTFFRYENVQFSKKN